MKLCVMVFLVLLSMPAASQKFSAWGVGTISCGKWLDHRTIRPNDEQLLQWVFGFISGHNYANSQDVRPPDAEAALAFIDTYCRNNPLHVVTLAGAALLQELGGKQAQHSWKH